MRISLAVFVAGVVVAAAVHPDLVPDQTNLHRPRHTPSMMVVVVEETTTKKKKVPATMDPRTYHVQHPRNFGEETISPAVVLAMLLVVLASIVERVVDGR